MDTSKEYIKMCEKAEEIQNLCPFRCRTMTAYSQTSVTYFDESCVYFLNDKYKEIWLPRQDQLQEMVAPKEDVQHLLLHFYNRVGALFNEKDKPWLQFKSFEQLWLAFVMKEKYNKIWNGKDWEKIK